MRSVFLKATQDAAGFCPRQCGMGGGSTSRWPQNRVRTETGPGRCSGHEEGPLRSSRDVTLHSWPRAGPWQPLRPPSAVLPSVCPPFPPSLPPGTTCTAAPHCPRPRPAVFPAGVAPWKPLTGPVAPAPPGSLLLRAVWGPPSCQEGCEHHTCGSQGWEHLPDGSGGHQSAWAAPQRQARETQGRVQASRPQCREGPQERAAPWVRRAPGQPRHPLTGRLSPPPAGMLMVCIVIGARKLGVNPDNIATPIAASLGDLITLSLLAFVSSFFHKHRGRARGWGLSFHRRGLGSLGRWGSPPGAAGFSSAPWGQVSPGSRCIGCQCLPLTEAGLGASAPPRTGHSSHRTHTSCPRGDSRQECHSQGGRSQAPQKVACDLVSRRGGVGTRSGNKTLWPPPPPRHRPSPPGDTAWLAPWTLWTHGSPLPAAPSLRLHS